MDIFGKILGIVIIAALLFLAVHGIIRFVCQIKELRNKKREKHSDDQSAIDETVCAPGSDINNKEVDE